MPQRDGADSLQRVRQALIVQEYGRPGVSATDYLAIQSRADPTTAADVREGEE